MRKILFVDDSVDFGGASISLAEVLPELTGIEPLVATRLPRELARQLFGKHEYFQAPSAINYLTRQNFSGLADRYFNRSISGILKKGYGAIDLAYTSYCSHWIGRQVSGDEIDLVYCNNNLTLLAYHTARTMCRPLICL